MTRATKRQIDNNKVGQMTVAGFTASGTSDIVTSELVTAAIVDSVTVIPSTGIETSLGFLVTTPDNKIIVVDDTNKTAILDVGGNEVFGRLTEASGVYTLSYFTIISGVETVFTASQDIIFFPSYNYGFKDFPFNNSIRVSNDRGTNNPGVNTEKIIITSNTTLTQHYDIVEINAPSSVDVEVKLPDNTSLFAGKKPTQFVRIDDFTNTNAIVKITGETASNLQETNQEIILDIILSSQIYFSSADNKYRSVDGTSERRKQELQNRSTALTITSYDQNNYITVDTTSQAHETAEILQPGEGWIIDRTLDDFNPKVYKISFPATAGIDTATPNEDGNFIIHVSNTGVITMESINARSLLMPFSVSGANANTDIQIGQFARSGGVATSAAQAIQGLVNTPMEINNLWQAFGTLNSAANPLGLEANGANLNVNFTAGEGIGSLLGWTGQAGGLSPNLNILISDITQAGIILTTRDNVIQGSGIEIDVTQIEDPNNPGTLLTMGNNNAKVNFYRGFPDEEFVTESLGQVDYGTISIALLAAEQPEFPSLVNFGFSLSEIFVDKDETDLAANATFKKLPRIDLT